MRSALRPRLPREGDFGSRLHSPAVASRLGVWLGACFGVCFLTGLVSHYAQSTVQPVPFPTAPVWGYRVTQGVHVLSGTAAVPLLLVKLWTVYPRLFRRPPRPLRPLLLEAAERGSVALLVAGAVFQLASGLANSAQWYPWRDFSFRSTHYAVAWLVTGALLLHVAVKLPVVRQALAAPIDHDTDAGGPEQPEQPEPAPVSRRTLLRSTWLAAGVAVLATAGSSVPWLRRVSVLATTTGDGPGGLPVNTTAAEAGVVSAATRSGWQIAVEHDGRIVRLSREQLLALSQREEELPIACVEGWSATACWTGVRLRDLLDLVGAPRGREVVVESLQPSGPFTTTVLPGGFADDDRTLVALGVSGAPLALDHGYPARLIAPNRPGVLQTKWLHRLVVR